MTIWEDLFKTPFGPHWAFRKTGYARLPINSRIFPVFLRKGFSTGESIRCDIPDLTTLEWIVIQDSAFKPIDLPFDTRFLDWNNKSVHEMVKLEDLMLVKLAEPTEATLQGRTYVAFLLFLEDLQA